jgi:hypothetical protein
MAGDSGDDVTHTDLDQIAEGSNGSALTPSALLTHSSSAWADRALLCPLQQRCAVFPKHLVSGFPRLAALSTRVPQCAIHVCVLQACSSLIPPCIVRRACVELTATPVCAVALHGLGKQATFVCGDCAARALWPRLPRRQACGGHGRACGLRQPDQAPAPALRPQLRVHSHRLPAGPHAPGVCTVPPTNPRHVATAR